ncbi:pyridine nucleotide-disulfide oxidoreductase [Mycobacteroides stephanolepidis]|uniref:ferredoxin--NADP(+) reductase n=1 Tax=[Mycobacterium] stephanolepidis TaxID=1520670 RepID=A0A1Z4EWF0_9MYCO|nr:FAD-dependent oxidoreductase [[Mycobacterium] stephanolepidis]BAX97283.1 pyridine nucleotide-disulfide oxidoreductase [[Mycobacterium] stephanolepidis]
MNSVDRALRVAIIGAGPAGIYAADALTKSGIKVSVDLFERIPAPFGLIRYGVAPDHPRIKGIVTALHRVMDSEHIRLFGNVEYGTDIRLDDLRRFFDAVVFSTGANADRTLAIPGCELKGSYGAADFVSWYNGHPDAPRHWPLDAEKVAVLGVGNVALDVARILAKSADELLHTEIPASVYSGLKANKAKEIHVFGRRGPAQARFTPLELSELDASPSIEVIVDPLDTVYDEASCSARNASKVVDMIASTIDRWACRDRGTRPHRLFLHFLESPVEIVGAGGKVVGLRTERTELDGTGNAYGTGSFTQWEVDAVYRAVGYRPRIVSEMPCDQCSGIVPNIAGRVREASGTTIPATYVAGWAKRGPVGLIGHTKGDASETIACLIADSEDFVGADEPGEDSVTEFLDSRGIRSTSWEGWHRLDAHERSLGASEGRDRIKVVDREDMLRASLG